MHTKTSESTTNAGFALKTVETDFTSRTNPSHAFVSLSTLEKMRTSKLKISASKNELQKICGASCDTGAL